MGHLIGPKHGTEIVGILEIFGLSVTVQKLLWTDCVEFR